MVTGPSGGEIHTDDLGRIKVRLLWDRKGPKDDQSSCWVRVMQPFAGAWGGTWFLPRVNDEVIVGFMNGNPDYPICVGSVYNMDGKPPFTLPGKKTQSGFLTRSTPQGQGSNILRVDDAKGSEEFYFHAEKDMNVVVENNRDVKVKADHTETIKNNRSATIETGNESLTVSGGNMTTKISAGSQTTDAMQSITLKVGGNSITIDQQGITIKGMMVSVQGSLSAEVKGGASLTLSGGVTKIN